MSDLKPTSLPDVPDALVRLATAAEGVGQVDIVQSLWSGYGNIYRCALEGGLRPSVVVKHVRWPSEAVHPRGWHSDTSHARKVRSYEVETFWYQHVARRCTEVARVPECLAVVSHGEETVMVLEDLDSAGFSSRRRNVSSVEITACLRWLASFHAAFLGASPEGLWQVGTYWHLDTRPEEFAVLPDGELKRAASAIDEQLRSARYQTLVHGDAKLANFCFTSDGDEVAAVDFQYVGGGCGIKDVAYFLSSCLSEGECEEREAEVLELYFAELHKAVLQEGWAGNFAELESEWRSLYPVAWTDFYRFLKGWSPGHWKIHRYTERLARSVLAAL